MILPELVRGIARGAINEISAVSTFRKLRTAAAIFRASGSAFGFFTSATIASAGSVSSLIWNAATQLCRISPEAFSTTLSISCG